MICSACGVKNVEFATTCYSCRQPIGRSSRAAAAPATHELAPYYEPAPAPRDATAASRRRAAERLRAAGLPGARALRLLAALALLWVAGRLGTAAIRDAVRALSGAPQRQSVQTVEREAAPPPAAEQPEGSPIEEQNGLRLVVFEWNDPPGGPRSRYRVGETVSGRSEIQGFGVTADGRIDLIVALAFRDPSGALVEPVSPKVLRQAVQSPTIYSSFEYAISPEGPPGDYDLEIAVDDAVSTRSARFHRAVTVAAAAE